jgi:hypothetical protein
VTKPRAKEFLRMATKFRRFRCNSGCRLDWLPTETPDDKRQDRDSIYVKRQFDTEIIVLCVRWYISYRLSYRDAMGDSVFRNLRRAGIDLPARSVAPGVLTRPTSRSRANGTICTEPWTSKDAA